MESLPTYSEFAGTARTGRPSLQLSARQPRHVKASTTNFQLSVNVPTATIFVLGFALLEATVHVVGSAVCGLVSVDFEKPQTLPNRPGQTQAEPQRANGPLLEMRLPKR